jgi:hypothetical protein
MKLALYLPNFRDKITVPCLRMQFFKLPRKPHAVGAALDHETPVPTPRTVRVRAAPSNSKSSSTSIPASARQIHAGISAIGSNRPSASNASPSSRKRRRRSPA